MDVLFGDRNDYKSKYYLEELYERTIQNLQERLKEIRENFEKKLTTFEKNYKTSLKRQVESLRQLRASEIQQNLDNLKQEIQEKQQNLSILAKRASKFTISAFFKSLNKSGNEQIETKIDVIDVDQNQKKRKREQKADAIFQCPICQYQIDKKQIFLAHVNTHNLTMKFKCPYCEFSSFELKELGKHSLNTHYTITQSDFDNSGYYCPFKKQWFRQLGSLLTHIRNDTNYRVYQ